jgi:light-regulated signal transduction histidine kinase (bacteriophytochrome)
LILATKFYQSKFIKFCDAIAQVIAENHQGKITVESKLAQGTTFCVNLPVISTVL